MVEGLKKELELSAIDANVNILSRASWSSFLFNTSGVATWLSVNVAVHARAYLLC